MVEALSLAHGGFTEAILRRDWAQLDEDAPAMLAHLERSPAALVWHKCGTFEDHLVNVWAILCAWRQPRHCARLGLFHSAYGNSFVAMRIFDASRERGELAVLLGERAESLVFNFCSVDRQQLENLVLREGTIRSAGYELTNIRGGGGTDSVIKVTQADAAEMLVETMADYAEQSFGWQSDLEASAAAEAAGGGGGGGGGGVGAGTLWPGAMAPTLRLGTVSRFGAALRKSGALDEARLPPCFDACRAVLGAAEELEARDLYWGVVGGASGGDRAACVAQLARSSLLNPWVGEPHVLRAQLLLAEGAWAEARAAAALGLQALELWATAWDKRMPWPAWVNWARVLGLQASARQWPQAHGGLESLGATEPSMQFRELNEARELRSGGSDITAKPRL
jgi:hypothetical protein